MNGRAEAFILQTKSGQCVAGLETELAEQYGRLEFVITQGKERPTP